MQYILYDCCVCIYASVNRFGYILHIIVIIFVFILHIKYYLKFFACFFCIHFFNFCFGTVNLQDLLFKDKRFAPLH